MKERLNLLFQGDPITACGRPFDLERKSYCESLGDGSVNTLHGRWEWVTINRKPAILSLLIGVNDVWHGQFRRTLTRSQNELAMQLPQL